MEDVGVQKDTEPNRAEKSNASILSAPELDQIEKDEERDIVPAGT